MSNGGDDRPEYRVYGSGRKRPGRRPAKPARDARAGLDELRGGGEGDPGRSSSGDGERPYSVYRARPRGLLARLRGAQGVEELREEERRDDAQSRDRRPITPGRVLRWLVVAVVGWTLLSLATFVVSAQIQKGKTSDELKDAVSGGTVPLVSGQTILVIGTDDRPDDSKEPGANTGPTRADSLLLMRAGGGRSGRLSILRDTVVDIPGVGRSKINAAYAAGGPALTVQTVERFLGLEVDHVVEVDFENFRSLIDSLGGIKIRTGCVFAKINGGRANGGVTLRLRKGEHQFNGKRALAYARVRKNDCRPNEDDRQRAVRQQQVLAALKSRAISISSFIRGPLVGWTAPKALRTDMGGISLLGLAASLGFGGDPPARVLKPSAFVTLPDGGSALEVSEAEKQREVRRFLK